MPPTPLTIWSNYKMPPDMRAVIDTGLAAHRLLIGTNSPKAGGAAGKADPALADADIAFGQPGPAAVIDSPRLKWVHLTSAGYERYDSDDLRAALRARGAMLTNSSSVYDDPCAQHALAFMLAHARQLPDSLRNQWNDRSWPISTLRSNSQLLTGQTALLLGFGAIARRLIEFLMPFGMNLMAIRRSPRGDEPVPAYPESELKNLLPRADHVVNLLPGGQGTHEFVNAACFAAMKPSAVFYNIGRGSTVDQAALQASLETGRLAAAYLDVMQPEPLPPDHPLWKTPRCYITPHTAGGHAGEQVRLARHFLDNFTRYTSGQPLRDRIA